MTGQRLTCFPLTFFVLETPPVIQHMPRRAGFISIPHRASPPIPAATRSTCERFVLCAHDFITIILFLVAYDDLIALMMILVAYALQDEPAEESVDHRLGRGA